MEKIYYAKWLKAPEDFGTVCPVYIRRFSAKNIKKAVLQISALGVYEARLNGERVGDFILAPGWTNDKKRLQYQEYDLTPLLKEENTLEVLLGQGWRFHSGGITGSHFSQFDSALIAAIGLTDEDGSEEVICTDETWKVRKSGILYSNFYHGETFDPASVDNREVDPVYLLFISRTILIPQEGNEICEYARIPAKKILITPKGENVIDFGENVTARLECRIKGTAGEHIRFTFGETLDENGNFYNKNYRDAKVTIDYISDGKERVYKPAFFFTGARYVKVDNWSDEIGPDRFTLCALSSVYEPAGNFECSDERLNRLFGNVKRTFRNNYVDVPTDCPQRDERLGWTADFQLSYPAAAKCFDMLRFTKKWLRDLASEQYENGDIPSFSPFRGILMEYNTAVTTGEVLMGIGGYEYSDAILIVPWITWLTYRDASVLREFYPVMGKWLDRRIRDWKALKPEGSCGDWLSVNTEGNFTLEWMRKNSPTNPEYKGHTDSQYMSYMYLYYILDIYIKISDILGVDAKAYTSTKDQLYRYLRSTYVKDGKLTIDTQTGCVLALRFGVCDERDDVSDQLAQLIRNKGYIDGGFVGASYVLQILCDYGYEKLAYDMLFRDSYPSWLYPLTKGATTIWEQWGEILPDGKLCQEEFGSHDHHAFGAVADMFFTHIAGIRYDECSPGYKHTVFKPVIDKRLSYVKASLPTRYGVVSANWKIENEICEYQITVPEGASGTVFWEGISKNVGSGTFVFTKRM